MPVAYNSLLLTPKGPMYIYNLRRGDPIWVYEHNRFVSRPFDFNVIDRQPALEVRTKQQSFTVFEGKPIMGGHNAHVTYMLQHEVMTLQGYMDIVLADGKTVPRIPFSLLSPKSRPDADFVFGPKALKRLERNQNDAPVKNDMKVSIDSVGPLDDPLLFGGKAIIESVWATSKNIPAVNIHTANCITNGLIVRGD